MEIREHEPLKDKTTLKVGGAARYYVETDDVEAAARFAKEKGLPLFILGGGSNIVLPDTELPYVVLHPTIQGMDVLLEDASSVTIRVGAGVSLDAFIAYTVSKGWWGLENLSWIPGLVGGLAIQNVGAYGVEASSYIKEVGVYDLEQEVYGTLSNEECQFGYRSSIFNTTKKGRCVVTHIDLVLSKVPNPVLSYRSIEGFKENPTQEEIRERVIEIRDGKDLSPERVYSVGSFFKNIEVSSLEDFSLSEEVKGKVFSTDAGYKIPSGALIEDVGLKGFCIGDACVSEVQANMLINKGGAKSEDIQKLYEHVQKEVLEKTGVGLTNEPEFV